MTLLHLASDSFIFSGNWKHIFLRLY